MEGGAEVAAVEKDVGTLQRLPLSLSPCLVERQEVP